MYIINTRIYPFRGYSRHSFSDFGTLSDALMESLLKQMKVNSLEMLVQTINNAFRNDEFKKQIITSVIEIKTTKNFPFLKITKIAAS